MNLKKKIIVFILLILFFFIFITLAYAENENIDCETCFVSIVNPIRTSRNYDNTSDNIKSQYKFLKLNNLAATWLFDYKSLTKDDVVNSAKNMDTSQELGIFLEVTPELAEEAGVKYNNSESWHHATSVFLSGYSQKDRIKLIDTVFTIFNQKFGYYPKSVGSWWTDSYSLTLMKEKYGITANLTCADQLGTDGYTIWGQYWSAPFYPSKYHTGIPAPDSSVKLDVVVTQWAVRDPWKGYESSLYSTQDYMVEPVAETAGYFNELLSLYTFPGMNGFGHITVGLEGDLTPDAYTGEYAKQMEIVGNMAKQKLIRVVTMADFSEWYRGSFKNLSPPHIVEKEYLESGNKVRALWYQSPNYRLGILQNDENKETRIIDFRSYHKDLVEPYYLTPNRQYTLNINIPSYFDSAGYRNDYWKLNQNEYSEIKEIDGSSEEIFIRFEPDGYIKLTPDAIIIDNLDMEVPKVLSESKTLETSERNGAITIKPKTNWLTSIDGITFNGLSPVGRAYLESKRVIAVVVIIAAFLAAAIYKIVSSKLEIKRKLFIISLFILPVIYFSADWWKENTQSYYVSQAEIDALNRLSWLPAGKVLIYNRECFGCEWESLHKPASFSIDRNYVKRFSRHQIVYNQMVFDALTQEEAREEFKKTNAKYIYLAKNSTNIEKIPFSPGDLNIEKYYSNANAEIWMVKEN